MLERGEILVGFYLPTDHNWENVASNMQSHKLWETDAEPTWRSETMGSLRAILLEKLCIFVRRKQSKSQQTPPSSIYLGGIEDGRQWKSEKIPLEIWNHCFQPKDGKQKGCPKWGFCDRTSP